MKLLQSDNKCHQNEKGGARITSNLDHATGGLTKTAATKKD